MLRNTTMFFLKLIDNRHEILTKHNLQLRQNHGDYI